jgi:molybdopterin-guanine dinucleotide biosynthesis protein B
MERLVADITGRGFSVSTVKHVHHAVDLDQPGKDSFRHRQAGAREVVLASADRFALMVEHRGPEPELPAILARLAPVDLVLVEGYKRDAHPKVEVWRAETGQPLIQAGDPLVRAVATDADLALPVPVLDLNDTRSVADFILREVGLLRPAAVAGAFDRVIIVDWSASASPSPEKPSADAIWIGEASATGERATYHRTRHAAEVALREMLATDDRVLVGFDFPMGFPAGFAQRLTGSPSARAVHAWLAEAIQDTPDNRNNRFDVAAAINKGFGTAGPFWGCPAGVAGPHLTTKRLVDYAALGLSERRAVEQVIPRSQPVWKLYTTGSVGSQSLTGLPVVHRLGLPVWPFDPPAPRMVAEVYPSLLTGPVALEGGIKDAAQVRLLARALLALSRHGRLDPLFSVPAVAAEEGWILGAGQGPLLEEALTWA